MDAGFQNKDGNYLVGFVLTYLKKTKNRVYDFYVTANWFIFFPNETIFIRLYFYYNILYSFIKAWRIFFGLNLQDYLAFELVKALFYI